MAEYDCDLSVSASSTDADESFFSPCLIADAKPDHADAECLAVVSPSSSGSASLEFSLASDEEVGLDAREEADLEFDTEGGSCPVDDGLGLHFEVEGPDCSTFVQSWRVGVNCGTFVNSMSPLSQQAQVLICNAAANLSKLPRALQKDLASRWGSKSSKRGKNYQERLVAGQLGLSNDAVARCVARVKQNGWHPVQIVSLKARGRRNPTKSRQERAKLKHQVWEEHVKSLVTVALGCAVEGQSGQAFERQVARLQHCGLQLSGACGHSRHFCRDVEFLATKVVEVMDACEWTSMLPGLGICSDISVMADPVSIGSSHFARHETVLVVHVTLVSRQSGALYMPMAGFRVMGLGDHAGDKLKHLILAVLSEHQAGIGLPTLRSCLALVNGDGQMVKGGPQHRHHSTQAAEKLWDTVYPGQDLKCTRWDDFHRLFPELPKQAFDYAVFIYERVIHQTIMFVFISKQSTYYRLAVSKGHRRRNRKFSMCE